ncbi:phage tail protein [Paraflavitalea pollutisoli]|uniref:phage tail protein n=1 Tax=Paraflavitalea pollutisoli TaxID=3034143 RepID=UPI0023EBAFC3|nr:tail fiber protein [Paraflavitalea sp. H1-2-19X]
MDGVLAYVTLFAGNFAPRNWALCAGQIVPISQNTALFSLIGTYYGGNGTTTFALPDLRGRMVIGVGQGPGLSDYVIGQSAGTETNTLTTGQMPQHVHAMTVNITPASATNATTNNPNNCIYAPEAGGGLAFASTADGHMKPYNVPLNSGITGQTQPFDNHPPFLALNYIICMAGVFPARN